MQTLPEKEEEEKMLTLLELFDLTWDIAELDITARDPELKFLHEWIFGEHVRESTGMYHRRMAGDLTLNQTKIQMHGNPTRGGSETGWGVNEKLLPKGLIEAPVTHLAMRPMPQNKGTFVRVDVELSELTAMTISKKSYLREESQGD